jgi:hypothetical protein
MLYHWIYYQKQYKFISNVWMILPYNLFSITSYFDKYCLH